MSSVKRLARLFRSTAVRLALMFMAVFALSAVMVVGYIYWNTNLLLARRLTATIDAEIRVLSENYQVGGMRRLVSAIEQRAAVPGDTIYLLANSQGRAIAGNLLSIPSQISGPPGWIEFSYEVYQSGRRELKLARARTFRLQGGFSLLVGRDIGEQRRFEQVITSALIWSLGLTMLIGLFAGWIVSRRMLVRIGKMRATSQRIMAGNLSERISVTGSGDELDQLAISLNGMLDQIERLLIGLREVSDNIAHDLKTPLTRLRNRVETALRAKPTTKGYRSALEQAIEDSDHLIDIFNALLSIARAEAGVHNTDMTEIDGAAMAHDIAELYGPLAEEQGCVVRVEAPSEVFFEGNRELISQVLANLLDNSLKYGRVGDRPRTKSEEIVIRVTRLKEIVEISVLDCGPGIPESERERVLNRFARLESSRSLAGSGLGLSLAVAVVHLHGGDLRLEDNPGCDNADHEPGLVVTIALPSKN